MGIVIRRWVWLEWFKDFLIIIIITYPYILHLYYIALFAAASLQFFVHAWFKCFFFLFINIYNK